MYKLYIFIQTHNLSSIITNSKRFRKVCLYVYTLSLSYLMYVMFVTHWVIGVFLQTHWGCYVILYVIFNPLSLSLSFIFNPLSLCYLYTTLNISQNIYDATGFRYGAVDL